MNQPFIILDRDGVINFATERYVKSPDEFQAIPGSLEAIAELNRAGFRVMIATNQSGIARGIYNLKMLGQIHACFAAQLAAIGGHVEEIFCCPHHPDENCVCRKPAPGLLHQIQKKYPIDFANTFFIGDSDVDVKAALAAGCKPLLVRTGKGEQTLLDYPEYQSLPHFDNLKLAVNYVLSI